MDVLLTENYTLDELRAYIRTKLGGQVWRLEGMSLDRTDTIDQAISDAVMAYSRRCPQIGFEMVQSIPTKQVYTVTTPGFGVWACDFIYPTPVIAPFMQSLVGVTPLNSLTGGDFDLFLHWRKSFQRVTSTLPHWQWDGDNEKLYIYNPIAQGRVCAFTHLPRPFANIKMVHKEFIKRYSLALAKQQLAEHRRKFDSIPGPGGKELRMNGDKLAEEANASIEKLHEELMGFQMRPVPRWD